jgi:hypothetical protein
MIGQGSAIPCFSYAQVRLLPNSPDATRTEPVSVVMGPLANIVKRLCPDY